MKKKILKNVAIISFALFGLGIIGNNVMYGKDSLIEEGDGGGSGCSGNYCEYSNWFMSCSACCDEYSIAECTSSGCTCK